MSGPSADGSAHPRRHRRLLVIAIAASIGWKVLFVGVGGLVAAFAVNDGVDQVPVDMRSYAGEALATARVLWGGPIERHGIRGVRVLSVERLASSDSAARCGGLAARVRAYTFFAIPYSEVRTVCDQGTVEYRGLPRLRRGH
jgi:hypothetical protein